MLGDVELADVPKAERVKFMSGVTVTALPVATPAAAGLLGTAFLNCFPGGVEFRWGPWGTQPPPGAVVTVDTEPPTIAFYGDETGTATRRAWLTAVPVKQLPESLLPTVMLNINGIDIPALLDTGSPITVLNPAAALASGLQQGGSASDSDASKNPFAFISNTVQKWKAGISQDTLTIAGQDGPVQLLRASSTEVKLGSVSFGDDTRPYIGEVPGLAKLNGLGADVGPAAILGTDVLCRRPSLWYTPTQVYL
jgi:hypothetical protein